MASSRLNLVYGCLFINTQVLSLLATANKSVSNASPTPTETGQPATSSVLPTIVTRTDVWSVASLPRFTLSMTTETKRSLDNESTKETATIFKWELWKVIALVGFLIVFILLLCIIGLAKKNRTLRKVLHHERRIREQSHQLRHQRHVTSRAAFSIIAASSAEELATVLQNERRGQLPPDFKRPEGNERRAVVFQNQTYSIGTSKSVERLVALLNGAKRTDKDQNGNNGDESAQSSTVLCGSASKFQSYAFQKEDNKGLNSKRTSSVLSRVQAFEQGKDGHDTDFSKEKAKETRREPKKLKYLEQLHSTATQLDDEERQKREAEIRPLGGIPKKFNMSPSCLPLPEND